MRHTPGPWKKWEATDPDIGEPTEHVALVNDTFIVGSGPLGKPGHDARLIAAAPTLADVVRLGVAARTAQAAYFRDRSKENLIASKQAEAAFDRAAREVLAQIEGQTEQVAETTGRLL